MTDSRHLARVTDVIAIIATYRRDDLLLRLLNSIVQGNPEVGTVYVADNGGDELLKKKLENVGIPVVYIPSPNNPGCGAGLYLGEIAALQSKAWKYAMILDDDAVLGRDCVKLLKASLDMSASNMAVPMILDSNEKITSIPGLLSYKEFRAIRCSSPAGYMKSCGSGVVPFDWCPGVCMLVKREALESEGLHSSGFWMLGEDLEFSMRLSKGCRNIFVPDARAWHLPPAGRNVPSGWIMIKETAMLLNLTYLGFHKSYCRRLLKHLPGNIFRFLRFFGFRFSAVRLAVCALYWGSLKKETAGSERFQDLVRRARQQDRSTL